MDGVTFEQWVLFIAVTFKQRYKAVAQARYPQLPLPLVSGGQLHVVQVNGGEAVHFIFTATQEARETACRHLTVTPPEGLSLQDWALLHEEGYKRFVERSVPGEPVGHFVLFPGQRDEHAASVLAADRIVREHAAMVGA
ncbi:MAG: hypothetical protein LC624_04700 [Halobacteriales archaeon]|nr:hypothetical protein [Halobacteriales archaeon]